MPSRRSLSSRSASFFVVVAALFGAGVLGGHIGGCASPPATPTAPTAPQNVAAPTAGLATGAQPNLLFILVDTLRADALGVYGQDKPTSPRIDAFAAGAVVYAHAWTQYTWTSPSYVSFMTSRYARTHGWDYPLTKHDTWRTLDDQAPMLAQVLSGAGYATNAQFSQPNLRKDLAFDKGFDTFTRGAEVGAVRGAVAAIGKWKADPKPNFLYVHLMAPHVPLKPTEASRTAVGAAPIDTQISYAHWATASAADKATRLEEFRGIYLASVRDADTSVGAILDALDASGLAGETAVVLTSDHGELLGEHDQIGHAGTTAEALTHVPLVLRAPGLAPRREAAPASLIDIAPTLAALAGAPAPAAWQGRSLLDGTTSPLIAERDGQLSVSDGVWKLTEDRLTGRFLAAYDLSKDPSEATALTAEDPAGKDAIAGLAAAADAFRARLPDGENTGVAPTMGASEKAKQVEELKALGYVE